MSSVDAGVLVVTMLMACWVSRESMKEVRNYLRRLSIAWTSRKMLAMMMMCVLSSMAIAHFAYYWVVFALLLANKTH